uniref:phosphopyruvate hydratase n=1 Tax=Salix viminalis TaxID=40686 RepID=A0A6N2LGJ9_SALVM
MTQSKIGMDVAASEFLKDGKYDLNFKNKSNNGARVLSPLSFGDLYKEFPFVSTEDPFDLDDHWSSWASIQSSVDIQFVGDNLLVTNPKRIAEEIQKKACNGLLMEGRPKTMFFLCSQKMKREVNQIGTVTESIRAALDRLIKTCRLGCDGQPPKDERLARYNQLLRIEEELGNVRYAGVAFGSPLKNLKCYLDRISCHEIPELLVVAIYVMASVVDEEMRELGASLLHEDIENMQC